MTSRAAVPLLFASLLAGAAATGGCCTSMSRADEIVRHTQLLNRLHAEPAMQSAAHGLGAALLPVFPEEIYECELAEPSRSSPPGGDCIEWDQSHPDRVAVRDGRGTLHPALPIEVQDWSYARLARRGDELFLLVPKLTVGRVDRRKQCECDAMPHPVTLVKPRVVFIVDGAPRTTPRQVEVPVTIDAVSFDCAAYLL